MTLWEAILVSELRALLNDSNWWIQLSAVFGLALLRVQDISDVVDRAMKSNVSLPGDDGLVDWLQKLKGGSRVYPSLDLGGERELS
jgi:hypothetical protein